MLHYSNHSSITIEDIAADDKTNSNYIPSSSSSKLDRIKSWVRDIDPIVSQTKILPDDVEFNATLTACEANTHALISRSRSPSISAITTTVPAKSSS